MKKKFLLFLLTLLICFSSNSCKRTSFEKETKKEVILASFTVLADIIKNVAKDDFVVKSITKPGVEVHGYQPTPSDLIKASKAFVFIDNGFFISVIEDFQFIFSFSKALITIFSEFSFINFKSGSETPFVIAMKSAKELDTTLVKYAALIAWNAPVTNQFGPVSYTHLTLPTNREV